MNAIKLDRISVSLNKKTILNEISLVIEEGSCIALLGPSGSGKTTLLRVIAGFVKPSKGILELFGENAKELRPEKRNVSMLFQEPVLFPHLTVRKNATIGLSKNHEDLGLDFKVSKLIEELFTEEFIDRRLSDDLSGGEKQRAALLRTFVNAKPIILLDEPLKSALNVELRWKLMQSIKNLVKQNRITSIIVTHDFEEAAYIADKIAILEENGSNIYIASSQEMYCNPPTLDVARVLGKGNEIDARILFDNISREDNCPFTFSNGAPAINKEAHTVFIRPDKISIIEGSGFTISEINFIGDISLVELIPIKTNIGKRFNIVVSVQSNFINPKYNKNDEVGLKINPQELIVFNEVGKRINDN